VGQLEEENAALLAQLQASHRELEARAAAADAAHRQFEDLAAARAAQVGEGGDAGPLCMYTGRMWVTR
jgi:hypothetical protein